MPSGGDGCGSTVYIDREFLSSPAGKGDCRIPEEVKYA
jgi:hypothetical protein